MTNLSINHEPKTGQMQSKAEAITIEHYREILLRANDRVSPAWGGIFVMHGSSGNISRNVYAGASRKARKNINLFGKVASMARQKHSALFCVINLIQFVRLSGSDSSRFCGVWENLSIYGGCETVDFFLNFELFKVLLKLCKIILCLNFWISEKPKKFRFFGGYETQNIEY